CRRHGQQVLVFLNEAAWWYCDACTRAERVAIGLHTTRCTADRRPVMSNPKNSPCTPRSPRVLTAAEGAEDLNISLRTVRRLIAQKKLPVVRIGRLVRIRSEVLSTLIDGK